jgi:uncharacterized protein (UPF0276 family)
VCDAGPGPAPATSLPPDAGGPRLACSYGGRDPALLERLVDVVDIVEIMPDDLVCFDGRDVHLDPELLAPLRQAAGAVTLVAHGVGLSIASHDGPSPTYLRLLDELFAALDVAWHSEHLGYSMVDGTDLGTMLNIPRTAATLDLVAGRADAIRRRYGRPFLLENVAHLLPDPGGDRTAAAFLNELARESGCGLLVDAYNLRCDEANIGTDPLAFVAELDADRVGEVHVAGGVRRGRYRLDVHSTATPDDAVALAGAVLRRSPGAVLTFELLPQAVPLLGHDGVVAELEHLRSAMGNQPVAVGEPS